MGVKDVFGPVRSLDGCDEHRLERPGCVLGVCRNVATGVPGLTRL